MIHLDPKLRTGRHPEHRANVSLVVAQAVVQPRHRPLRNESWAPALLFDLHLNEVRKRAVGRSIGESDPPYGGTNTLGLGSETLRPGLQRLLHVPSQAHPAQDWTKNGARRLQPVGDAGIRHGSGASVRPLPLSRARTIARSRGTVTPNVLPSFGGRA